MESIPLTYGLGGIIVGAFLAGVATMLFLTGKLSSLRRDLIAEIHQSREEGDTKIAGVHRRVDEVIQRLQAHELHVATNFMTKDAVVAGFDKIERAVTGGFDKLEARLMRLEGIRKTPP